jgi:hypothetical protein
LILRRRYVLILLSKINKTSFSIFRPVTLYWFIRRTLEAFTSAHQEAVSSTDPDMNVGEVIIRIPAEATHLITEGRPLRIGIEFSLEQPSGGLHFVVPPGEGTMAEVHVFFPPILAL